jgi:hypothetical protein
MAVAPEMGLWVDGIGGTESEAIADLSEILVTQREVFKRVTPGQLTEYAKRTAEFTSQRLAEA